VIPASWAPWRSASESFKSSVDIVDGVSPAGMASAGAVTSAPTAAIRMALARKPVMKRDLTMR